MYQFLVQTENSFITVASFIPKNESTATRNELQLIYPNKVIKRKTHTSYEVTKHHKILHKEYTRSENL